HEDRESGKGRIATNSSRSRLFRQAEKAAEGSQISNFRSQTRACGVNATTYIPGPLRPSAAKRNLDRFGHPRKPRRRRSGALPKHKPAKACALAGGGCIARAGLEPDHGAIFTASSLQGPSPWGPM